MAIEQYFSKNMTEPKVWIYLFILWGIWIYYKKSSKV